MVSSIQNNTYTYNGNEYRRRNESEELLGYILATTASGIVAKALPSFSNPFLKQMKQEHANNNKYKDAFFKSIENSGLKSKGLQFENTQFSGLREIIAHQNGANVPDAEIKLGLNACYIPDTKTVKLNAEKATISGFHELGHAMNHLDSKFGRLLQKARVPGYTIAGLMGTVAILSRRKPKDAPRNPWDWVQDNCGKIAFAAMLPTVFEEGLASYKGVKLAKKSGLSDNLVKNLKKFYGKALLSYFGYALVTGVSVFAASKLTEIFTRPKLVED